MYCGLWTKDQVRYSLPYEGFVGYSYSESSYYPSIYCYMYVMVLVNKTSHKVSKFDELDRILWLSSILYANII